MLAPSTKADKEVCKDSGGTLCKLQGTHELALHAACPPALRHTHITWRPAWWSSHMQVTSQRQQRKQPAMDIARCIITKQPLDAEHQLDPGLRAA